MARTDSRGRNGVLLVYIENLVGGGGDNHRDLDIVDFVRGVLGHYEEHLSGFAIARAYANWTDGYLAPVRRNLHKADIELGTLMPALDELSQVLSAQRDAAPFVLTSLSELRAELLTIRALSLAATDYFSRLGRRCDSRFGAYERTGALRSLETSTRTILQL